MSFFENFTKIIDGNVHFNFEIEEGTNLVKYVNRICMDKCNVHCGIDNPPECQCEISYLYYAIVKLAEWESKGVNLKNFGNIIKEHKKLKQENEQLKNDFNFMQELYKGSESAKNLYLKGQHRAEKLNREFVDVLEDILSNYECGEEVDNMILKALLNVEDSKAEGVK